MRRSRTTILLLAALLGLPACTTWRARPGLIGLENTPREVVRLWVHGQAHDVHGVRVRGDSVTAVPFFRPPECDSCAVRFALRDVDSVTVKQIDDWKSFAAFVFFTPIVLVATFLVLGIPIE